MQARDLYVFIINWLFYLQLLYNTNINFVDAFYFWNNLGIQTEECVSIKVALAQDSQEYTVKCIPGNGR